MESRDLYGAIEAGGTKFNCMVGRGPRDILEQQRIETSTPDTTLAQVIDFFRPFCGTRRLSAIGVGCFGPVDLDRQSPTYGYITSTPKPGWQDVDVVGTLRASLETEIAIDTDVGAAALGEYTWGATFGTVSSLYLTVGTGIGGALLLGGNSLRGLQHSEMGHIRLYQDLERDPFPGWCPYHGNCLEGLASGPAIEKRFGQRSEDLSDGDPFWELEADYIAAALVTYILILSPHRIVVGGGIMQREFLLPRIRNKILSSLGGYVSHPAVLEHIDEYIVAPGLGTQSGILGGIALAARNPRQS